MNVCDFVAIYCIRSGVINITSLPQADIAITKAHFFTLPEPSWISKDPQFQHLNVQVPRMVSTNTTKCTTKNYIQTPYNAFYTSTTPKTPHVMLLRTKERLLRCHSLNSVWYLGTLNKKPGGLLQLASSFLT
jgi:hypothetical protein